MDRNDDVGAPRQPRRMLIADDDPAVLRLLAERCSKLGFKIDTATNGVQLLVKARQNHPDILVVDVNMPALDGLSVCMRLLDPGRKPLEVVVITGAADPETPERCEALGTFFGRKGPEFWPSIEAALAEIYPDLAERLELPAPARHAEVPQQPRVLVVDDDPATETFFASRLGKFGVTALYAPDVTQAYRIACRQHPSAIICDNDMPDGDARFLLSRLRTNPDTAEIPFFVISGADIDEPAQQALKRDICGRPGALQVFRKSFDNTALFEALQKFCGFTNGAGAPPAAGSALAAAS